MSQPVPEERNDAADLKPGDEPPGEHEGELPGATDGPGAAAAQQAKNATTSQVQPSS